MARATNKMLSAKTCQNVLESIFAFCSIDVRQSYLLQKKARFSKSAFAKSSFVILVCARPYRTTILKGVLVGLCVNGNWQIWVRYCGGEIVSIHQRLFFRGGKGGHASLTFYESVNKVILFIPDFMSYMKMPRLIKQKTFSVFRISIAEC